MKKDFKILLCLLMLCDLGAFQSHAQMIVIKAADAGVCIGDSTVTVPIFAENFNGVSGLSLTLLIDTNVIKFQHYLNVHPGLAGGTLLINSPAPGVMVKVAWFSLSTAEIGDGKLLDIKFKYKGGVCNLVWSSLPGDCDIDDNNGLDLPRVFIPGQIVASPAMVITSHPQTVVTDEYKIVRYSVAATYVAAYQWQISQNGSSFTDLQENMILTGYTVVSGVNTPTLTMVNAVFTLDTMDFRCKLTSQCGSIAYTNPARLILYGHNPFSTKIKVLLQGSWISQDSMRTDLRTYGLLPSSQPYNYAPYHYQGVEERVAFSEGICDWVLVELRSSPDSVVERRAGLLRYDGIVLDTNEKTGIYFNTEPGEYYIAIYHRNHLPVLSKFPAYIPSDTLYDFTDTVSFPVYCNCEINVDSATSAMISGDLTHDGQLKYSGSSNDRSLVLQKILSIVGGTSITATTTGYHQEDLNMNGQVKYSGTGNDPSLIIQNIVYLTGSNAITGVFNGCVPTGSFKRPQRPFLCGDLLVDDRDGKQYPTTLIGNQCWMKSNLNIGVMVESTSIGTTSPPHSDMFDNQLIEKYCYNNDSNMCLIYGGLYEWDEAMGYNLIPKSGDICPNGWYIPTDDDWLILEGFLDSQYRFGDDIWINSVGYRGYDVGGKLKEGDTQNWWAPNLGATNSSNFSSLPSGKRVNHGHFARIGTFADFWTSTSYQNGALQRNLSYLDAGVSRSLEYRTHGLAVRCIKDSVFCQNLPIQANAGQDSLNIAIDSLVLYANEVENDYGYWSIIRGDSAYISDIYSPHAIFKGTKDVLYVLSWNTYNSCTITSDTLYLRFLPQLPIFTCGDTLVDYRDNLTYPTVLVGSQCWMQKNLNYGIQIPGLNQMTDNQTVEKFCWSDNIAFCNLYGGIYQWDEAMNYIDYMETRGICPVGWHIPSDREWIILEGYLDSCYDANSPIWESFGYRGCDAGGKLKAEGTQYWTSPNFGASNSSGFSALPAGYRKGAIGGTGSLWGLDGYYTYFWSSSSFNLYEGVHRFLHTNSSTVAKNHISKTMGFSIRCIKD